MAEAKATAANAAKEDVKGEVYEVDATQDIVDKNREVLKEEAKNMEGTNGPADNVTGDASESPADHIFSNDPYKKAFPPGPDDPSKL